MCKSILAATALALALATTSHAMSERVQKTTEGYAAAQQSVTSSEASHMQRTGQVGLISLQTSQLAVNKAQSPVIRQFAQLEVNEQTTMADVLKSMYPSAPAPTLETMDNATLTRLQGLTGRDFDALYLESQLDAHRRLLQIQEDYLNDATNREQKNIARLAQGMISEHILLLQAYQQQANRR